MMICDTSLLVDIDRGNVGDRVDRLAETGRHTVSVVTQTELRIGVKIQFEQDSQARDEAMQSLARLVARFDVKPVTRPIGRVAADDIADLR